MKTVKQEKIVTQEKVYKYNKGMLYRDIGKSWKPMITSDILSATNCYTAVNIIKSRPMKDLLFGYIQMQV